MEKFLIGPNRGSKGGRALARALGVRKLSNEQQLNNFEGSPNKIVINWGNSEPPPEVMKCRIINTPTAVNLAVNKKTAFETMARKDVYIPSFTNSEEIAMAWVNNGHKVVARHILTGSGGEGIQILSSLEDFPCDAPLYVLYIPKKSEFRVHVMDGEVIDLQRKMRRRDVPDDKVNWLVRNHNNGFIFGRNGDLFDEDQYNLIAANSVKAVKSFGLDFGAVDIIWNEKQRRSYVLEVNTAPGIEGTTVNNYVDSFIDLFDRIERTQQTEPRITMSNKSNFRANVKYKRIDFDKFLNLKIQKDEF